MIKEYFVEKIQIVSTSNKERKQKKAIQIMPNFEDKRPNGIFIAFNNNRY